MNAVTPRVILVVERSVTAESSVAHFLRTQGLPVVSASSLAGAWAQALTSDVAFLITEIALPDGDGRTLMNELRLRGVRGAEISASAPNADLIRSHDAGFSFHLTQPVREKDLQAVIAAARVELDRVPSPKSNGRHAR